MYKIYHWACDAWPVWPRSTVTFPAVEHFCPFTSTKLYCLVTEAHVCEQLIQSRYVQVDQTIHKLLIVKLAPWPLRHHAALGLADFNISFFWAEIRMCIIGSCGCVLFPGTNDSLQLHWLAIEIADCGDKVDACIQIIASPVVGHVSHLLRSRTS